MSRTRACRRWVRRKQGDKELGLVEKEAASLQTGKREMTEQLLF